jgi:hypothetical protein
VSIAGRLVSLAEERLSSDLSAREFSPSCFDCRSSAYLPSGLGTVEELIEAAAAAIPPPSQTAWRQAEGAPAGSLLADPLNLHVLPPSAVHDDQAAEALGYVRLKPLQCCNG